MGIVKDEITLINARDQINAKCGLMNVEGIRSVTVTAVADSGALRLTIPESVREKLGLEIVGRMNAQLATGEKVECLVSEPVRVSWKDRATSCDAWVLPGKCNVLLGAIPMEGMDIMVDPVNLRLVGIHGDEQLGILY
jgi:predicted aspartyl protease